MGKHGNPVDRSTVVSHFRRYGYEYIEPDEFISRLNKDCVFLEFKKYVNPEHRRGDHIDILLRCGWYYDCEYRRGITYVNRTNDDPEDIRFADLKTHIKPISFEVLISCRSVPTSIVNSVLKGGLYVVNGSAVIGVNVNLKRIDRLLAALDAHVSENVPKAHRYFNKT
jgi:hypothetical protein